MTFLAATYGGYGTDTVSGLTFTVWSLILVGLGFGLLPRAPLTRPSWILIGLMVAVTGWAAVAISWSDDAGVAYIRAIQIAGASGIACVTILFSKRGEGIAWIHGLTLGFAAIILLAAISRFFPGIGNDAELTVQLGNIIGGRLSWPIGYWNALGLATACLLVLCVWHGGHGVNRMVRLAATAAIPVASVVMYLCSSRGSLVALAVGLAVIVGLGPRRRKLFGIVVLGVAGAIPLVFTANHLYEVVHAGTGSKATFQGLILLAATAIVTVVSVRFRDPVVKWFEKADLRHKTTLRILLAIGAIAIVALIASDPAGRISAFTTVPVEGIESSEKSNFATEHLLSESGNGRWQLWESSIDAFASQPILGIGSGGFESWFKQNGSFWMKTIDSHSMPLQFLSELGLIGFLLMAGSLGFAIYTGVRRNRSFGRDLNADDAAQSQPETAAYLALLAVGAFGFAIDWTGDFPVLFGPMMICIAALAGPLYAARGRAESPQTTGRSTYLRFALIAGAMLCSAAVMIASARQYEATRNIAASRAAFEKGDGQKALRHAQRAVSATPWASSTYAQLATVQETVDDGGAALASALEATARAPHTDTYWLMLSNIQYRLGLEDAAMISAYTAKLMNPNSLYWQESG